MIHLVHLELLLDHRGWSTRDSAVWSSRDTCTVGGTDAWPNWAIYVFFSFFVCVVFRIFKC